MSVTGSTMRQLIGWHNNISESLGHTLNIERYSKKSHKKLMQKLTGRKGKSFRSAIGYYFASEDPILSLTRDFQLKKGVFLSRLVCVSAGRRKNPCDFLTQYPQGIVISWRFVLPRRMAQKHIRLFA